MGRAFSINLAEVPLSITGHGMVQGEKYLDCLELSRIIELVPTQDLIRDAKLIKELNSGLKSFKSAFARFLDGMNDWPELVIREYDDDGDHEWGGRDDRWLRVSGLPYFCERKEMLKRLYPEAAQRIDPVLRNTFDIGTTVHSLYQNQYFGKMRILYGTWECPKCGYQITGFMPKDQCDCSIGCKAECIWPPSGWDCVDRDCAKCPKGVEWRYVEKRVRNEALRIQGHYDGDLRFENVRALLEIKTIDTNAFRFLRAPNPRQVLQARVYMRLEGFEQGVMVYVDKGGKSFPKFFPIEPDPQQTGELFYRIKEYWEHRDEAVKTGKLFPRTVCQERNKGLACWCDWAEQCFDPSVDRIHGVIDVE